MSGKYVLVDEDFQNRVLCELGNLKTLLAATQNIANSSPGDLMDTTDAMAFLKVTRRTLHKYRINGLPYERVMSGKIYYSRVEVLQFLSDQKPKIK
jgi:hypothetical protein